VVSTLALFNEVNRHWAWLLRGCVTVYEQVNHLSIWPATEVDSAFYPLWDYTCRMSISPRGTRGTFFFRRNVPDETSCLQSLLKSQKIDNWESTPLKLTNSILCKMKNLRNLLFRSLLTITSKILSIVLRSDHSREFIWHVMWCFISIDLYCILQCSLGFFMYCCNLAYWLQHHSTFICKHTYSVSQKNPLPCELVAIFFKTVGNFSTKFYLPIRRSYLR